MIESYHPLDRNEKESSMLTPTESDYTTDVSEASLDSLYRLAASEYLRLRDTELEIDPRDSVAMAQAISKNTGVSLSVAAAVIASANSVVRRQPHSN